jgi:hypothetical protein
MLHVSHTAHCVSPLYTTLTPFHKDGPRKTGRRKGGNNKIQTDKPEKTGYETKEPQRVKENTQGKASEKTVKKNLVTVDSSEEEP